MKAEKFKRTKKVVKEVEEVEEGIVISVSHEEAELLRHVLACHANMGLYPKPDDARAGRTCMEDPEKVKAVGQALYIALLNR